MANTQQHHPLTGESYDDDDTPAEVLNRWWNFMPQVQLARRNPPLRKSDEGTINGRCYHPGCTLPCCR